MNEDLQRIRENSWVGYNRLREELILALRQGDDAKVVKLDETIKEWAQSTIDSTRPWLYSEEYTAEMKRVLSI